MIAYRVCINDEPQVTAGADDLGVLTASVTSVGQLGANSQMPPNSNKQRVISCHVGGLTRRPAGINNEHLDWLKRFDLKVGDRIIIEVVESDKPDPAVSSRTE